MICNQSATHKKAEWVRACASVAVGLLVATSSALANAAVIVDAHGFEAPFFKTTFAGTGQLEGQTPATFNGTFLRTKGPGSSAATIQNAIVDQGSQAVQVTRFGNSDDRWGVPVDGYPSIGSPFVCIDWSMRVEQSQGPAGSFGPFFGIEAYDDDAAVIGLLGSLGVDATTGDVLFQAQDTGFLTETGVTVPFSTWHDYRIELNYLNDTYRFWVDGTLLGSQGFVDRGLGLNEFTDANIATVAAAGDAGSQGLGGISFFDNYLVQEGPLPCDFVIPEPATGVLFLVGLAGMAAQRRSRVCK